MPEVWIPALLRDLAGGQERVAVPGATVGQVIAGLETLYPGLAGRLCQEGRLRPSISLVVDGELGWQGLDQRLEPASEVHFLPAIGGG